MLWTYNVAWSFLAGLNWQRIHQDFDLGQYAKHCGRRRNNVDIIKLCVTFQLYNSSRSDIHVLFVCNS